VYEILVWKSESKRLNIVTNLWVSKGWQFLYSVSTCI